MAAHVAALYRYPVKSFTPEPRSALRVTERGRIEGDRLFGLLLGDAPPPDLTVTDGEWWPKAAFVTLMTAPGLARLALHYDDATRRLQVALGDDVLVECDVDEAGGHAFASALEAYVRRLDEAPDLDRPGRTPLRFVGDADDGHLQDRGAFVTLHGRGSLLALGEVLGDGALDERRFRSNIAVDGLGPWEELGWPGRRVRIGAVEFQVARPVGRCLATHASPSEGVRDRDILKTLTRDFGHEQPNFGVLLQPLGPGEIQTGAAVTLLD
ncbi:MAG: MOSC domain-containing protein [Chloroflexi bacterium]|nr:MOSC domain-containing protein [Chloroflexota bacterium]MDA1240341.1 MOSC domain-containing protein [Chloroflexota bacterium]MQC19173.1 MOSC domain-containing protein [Chloroflexota bacterium]